MWYTALVMGFAGSLHCLGMCSPLALAVTTYWRPLLLNKVLYNAGRIFIYGLMGAFVSVFGSFFRLSGYQETFSISLGIVLILLAIIGVSKIHLPFFSFGIYRVTAWIRSMFSSMLANKSRASMLLMGMLNGLLPCGLTYIALSYCIILPDPLTGFGYMMMFGLGTVPVMLGFTGLLQKLMSTFRISFRGITTLVLISLGIMLISRSLMGHTHTHSTAASQEEICIP
ncbi:MAG: sulfite exporter TauE/SafE family protein [Bacteroidetes bacterium]|nr:sulfite exporter TauE/SafE family protein [Bacteroidota bacterium]